jgi:predicted phosphodiesterase
MNIQLLSDLHLETHPQFVPQHAVGADVLVLAGDIGSYQSGSSIESDDFGLSRFANWPVPVVFVPGNHEYDALDFDEAHQRLQVVCARYGFHFLERGVLTHLDLGLSGPPVRFLGTTLWTDFDALTPQTATPTAALRAREKAFRAANFYLKKTTTTRHGLPFLAEQVREQSLLCQQWLRDALAQPFEGSTVVITHFAPSLQSADPRYGMTPGTAGFCNKLDDLLPQAQLWLHGHLHCPQNYVAHGCRVVANPLGYARKNEQTHFQANSLIKLESMKA